METVVGLCPVSAITQEPNENTFAFLESLKEALQKFTNLDLDSYKGQVILKDKFLSQCASDIRIKLPTVTAAGSCCLFRWDGLDSHQYFL